MSEEKEQGQSPEQSQGSGRDWMKRFEDERPAAAPEDMAEAEAAADAKERRACGGEACMPKPTFSTFILSLSSSALVQLGEVPDPATGETSEDLVMAKHSIDILSMLQEKIGKGLDAEEERLLNGLLYELRMKFVMKK